MKLLQVKKKYRKSEAGFTLVELIVSLGLFIIVILAAVGSLYSVNDTARRVEAMRSVLDNLNFAVESMSRTIRTGTEVGCFGIAYENCTFFDSGQEGPASQITIKGTLGRGGVADFRRRETTGPDGQDYGLIEKWVDGVWLPITAEGINVQHLSFYVEGAETGDELQPKVIIFMQGIATAGKNTAPFAIQTQVSLRSAEE